MVGRTYLGGHWDYLVRLVRDGDELQVHALPFSALEIGHDSPLAIDPAGLR